MSYGLGKTNSIGRKVPCTVLCAVYCAVYCTMCCTVYSVQCTVPCTVRCAVLCTVYCADILQYWRTIGESQSIRSIPRADKEWKKAPRVCRSIKFFVE
jgi:hypothetical protein